MKTLFLILALMCVLNVVHASAQEVGGSAHKPMGACNRVCVSKCEATGQDVVNDCIKVWDVLNRHHFRGLMTFPGCPQECKDKCGGEPSCIAKWNVINTGRWEQAMSEAGVSTAEIKSLENKLRGN